MYTETDIAAIKNAATRLSWDTYLANHDERLCVFADDEQPNACNGVTENDASRD